MTIDGGRLREARLQLHLSQAEAAELLEVCIASYQRWEQGKAKPHPYNLGMIQAKFEQGFRLVDAAKAKTSKQDDDTALQDTPVVFQSTPSSLTISTEDTSSKSNESDAPIAEPMTSHLLSLAFMEHPTNNDKRSAVRQAIKEFDTMNTDNKSYHITRREAMGTLASLAFATLGLSIPGRTVQPAQYSTALAHCAASIEGCWELSHSSEASDLALAFRGSSKYLPILEMIANNTSQYREEAIHLATQYALLKTILGWHCAGPVETVQYAKNAVILSQETKDTSLQLSAYSKLAWAYYYDKRYFFALQTAQEAEALLLQHDLPISPCIQGGIQSTLALMQIKNGQSPDVALGKALDIDPGDEIYAFMDFTRSTQLLEAGWTYCYKNDHTKAMETLEKRVDANTLTSKIPQAAFGRIETINIMALSTLRAKNRDMERTIHFWKAAIEGAKTLQSEYNFTEALKTYELMEVVWPGETRIAELRDLIQHWH